MTQRNYFMYAVLFTLMATTVFLWRSAKKNGPPHKTAPIETLLVGTNAEYQPFTFIDESGAIVGFDIDIAREVAKRLGKSIELIDRPFDTLLAELQLGCVHIVAAGMTPSEERAQRAHFTRPYFGGDPLIIITAPGKPELKTVRELDEKNVVVNEGFTADFYLSERPDINLTRLATISDAFMALKSGQVDAFVSAQSAAQPFFAVNQSTQYAVNVIEGTQEQYAIAISHKYPELLEPIQNALDTMQADGTIDTLKAKWGL